MQKADVTSAVVEIESLFKEVENLFAGRQKPVDIELLTPMLSCPIRTDKEKVAALVHAWIDLILSYASDHRVQVIYRVISGRQLIIYLKNAGLQLPEEEWLRFVQACNRATAYGTVLLENVNGNTGVELTGRSKVTFWFTIPYIPDFD